MSLFSGAYLSPCLGEDSMIYHIVTLTKWRDGQICTYLPFARRWRMWWLLYDMEGSLREEIIWWDLIMDGVLSR